jgi:hypothetical protein
MNKHIVKHIVGVFVVPRFPSKSGLIHKHIVKTYRGENGEHYCESADAYQEVAALGSTGWHGDRHDNGAAALHIRTTYGLMILLATDATGTCTWLPTPVWVNSVQIKHRRICKSQKSVFSPQFQVLEPRHTVKPPSLHTHQLGACHLPPPLPARESSLVRRQVDQRGSSILSRLSCSLVPPRYPK